MFLNFWVIIGLCHNKLFLEIIRITSSGFLPELPPGCSRRRWSCAVMWPGETEMGVWVQSSWNQVILTYFVIFSTTYVLVLILKWIIIMLCVITGWKQSTVLTWRITLCWWRLQMTDSSKCGNSIWKRFVTDVVFRVEASYCQRQYLQQMFKCI